MTRQGKTWQSKVRYGKARQGRRRQPNPISWSSLLELALHLLLRQFCTTGPNISLGGIWVGWSFRNKTWVGWIPLFAIPIPDQPPSDLIGILILQYQKIILNSLCFFWWDWVGWMIGKVRVEHKCKIISKFYLVGMKWDEKVKVEQKRHFFPSSELCLGGMNDWKKWTLNRSGSFHNVYKTLKKYKWYKKVSKSGKNRTKSWVPIDIHVK